MGVRKWLEKSAEKQKHKLRKTLNPLSRKAFQVVSFSATKDIGVTEFGRSDFLLPFVNFLMLMHRNVQLLLFGNLYAEKLVPYYIQEGYL